MIRQRFSSLLAAIIACLCVVRSIGQSISEFNLYIDSKDGSDWFSGSENAPLATLKEAFSKAQRQGAVHAIFHLVSTNSPYNLPGLNIDGINLPVLTIQTKTQTPEPDTYATVIVNSNAVFNQVNLTLNEIEVVNNQDNNYQIIFNEGSLSISHSWLNYLPMSESSFKNVSLFKVNQTNVMIEASEIPVASIANVLEANNSQIKIESTSIRFTSENGLVSNIFTILNSDLNISNVTFLGREPRRSDFSVFENAIFLVDSSNMSIQNVNYTSTGSKPIKFILGNQLNHATIDGFSIQHTIITSAILEFRTQNNDKPFSANLSRLLILNNSLPNTNTWRLRCPGIICFDSNWNLSLIVSEVTVRNNTKQNYLNGGDMSLFGIYSYGSGSATLNRISVADNQIDNILFSLSGGFNEILFQDVEIYSNTLGLKVMDLNLQFPGSLCFQQSKLRINNLNFSENQVTCGQFLSLAKMYSENDNASTLALNYLEIDNLRMSNNSFNLNPLLVSQSPSVFSSYSLGFRILNSFFSDNLINVNKFISLENLMVTVIVANSTFQCTNKGNCLTTRFFYYKEMDYNINSNFDVESGRYVPDFGAFCLLNNTFTEDWGLFDEDVLFTLNVANFFIHNNKFLNMSIQGRSLFEVSDIAPLQVQSTETIRILIDAKEKKITDPYLVDPLLFTLFERAIFGNVKADLNNNITCVFSFSGNHFNEILLGSENFVKISIFLPGTLFDFSSNVFSNIQRSALHGKNDFIKVLSTSATTDIFVRDNVLEFSTVPLLFLNIGNGVSFPTKVFVTNNTLEQNILTAFLNIDTSSSLIVNVSENTMKDSTIGWTAALRFVFREGTPCLNIHGNTFQNLSVFSDGFTQVGIIAFESQKEAITPVLFENNRFEQNFLIPKGLNPSVLGYKNSLVYFFNPRCSTVFKNNTFERNSAGINAVFLVIYSQSVLLEEISFIQQSSSRLGALDYTSTSIYVATQNLIVCSSYFEGNVAKSGGAFTVDYLADQALIAEVLLLVNITKNKFLHNLGSVRGGAIYFEDLENTPVIGEISNNHFEGNVAPRGSSIHLESVLVSNLTMAYNTFLCNDLFLYKDKAVGEAIYLSKLNRAIDDKNQTLRILHSKVVLYQNHTPGTSAIDVARVYIQNFVMKNISFSWREKERLSASSSMTLIRASNTAIHMSFINITRVPARTPLILLGDGANVTVDSSVFSDLPMSLQGCVFGIIQVAAEGASVTSLELTNSTIKNIIAVSVAGILAASSPIYINSNLASLVVRDTQFIKNTASNGAAIFSSIRSDGYASQATIQIYNSTFHSNRVENGGGAIYQQSGVLEIYNSSFLNNWANKFAGAVYIGSPTKVIIKDSLFENNSVTGFLKDLSFGGAAYIEISPQGPLKDKTVLSISSNTFTNNRVGSKSYDSYSGIGAGGALFFHFHERVCPYPTLYESILNATTENQFKDNFAMNGPDYSTNPYYGSFSNLNSEGNIVYECSESPCQLRIQAWADIFHGTKLRISFIDLFGQKLLVNPRINGGLVPMASDFKMGLQISNQSQLYFESNCSSWNCLLNGRDLSLKGLANQFINLSFAVSNPNYHSFDFVLMASIRSCQVGEINDTKQLVCTPCDKGTYSLNLSDHTCHPCPQNAYCPGGWRVNPLPGYWKPSIYSANIYKCNHSETCNHSAYGENICSPGYRGPFCLACDLDNGYASSGDGCAKCHPFWKGMLILVLIQLGIFIFEIGYIWYFRKKNNSVVVNNKFNKSSIDRFSRTGYLSILLDYIQVLAILKNYPLMVSGFIVGLTHIGSPSQMLFYSSDCVFIQLGFSVENLFYAKLVAITILPFLKIGLCLVFGFAKKFIYSNYHYRTYVAVAVQCIVLIEQPSLLSTFASTLLCRSTDPLANDQTGIDYYLIDHPHVTCYTETYYNYRNYLVIPMLAIWAVCYPLFIGMVLVTNRPNLQTREFASKFGNQYAIYCSKYYFWSLVQFVQKLILILFAQISFLSLKMTGLTLYLILIAYLLVIKHFQPYRSVDLQKTYIKSIYVFLCTLFLAVYGFEEDKLNGVISAVILIMNTAFIAYIVIKILHLFGFRYMTRVLNDLFNKIAGDSEKKDYFFDESYNARPESDFEICTPQELLEKNESHGEADNTIVPDDKSENSRYTRLNN